MNDKAPKILVVDDELGIREGCRKILATEGYEVETAEDGMSGLELFKKQGNFVAVLLDLKMPRMDGIELIERIHEYDEDTVLLVITAYPTVETAVEATKKGAYSYIPKPFTPDELLLPVKKGLERRALFIGTTLLRERYEPQLPLHNLKLTSSSRVAVIGGGPTGSFFSYFLLDMAQRVGKTIDVDMYESKNFLRPGHDNCNMCAGVISESLVQMLAAEGIHLPSSIVQGSIDSYVMHMDGGNVRIKTPLHEKRIATVYRGGGLQGIRKITWPNFDGYLQELAIHKGTHLIRKRVIGVSWKDDRPQLKTRDGSPQTYDLLGVAAGVNSHILKFFNHPGLHYEPPQTIKTYIGEFFLGQESVQTYFGSSIHVFLLNIPRLKFAALIPKGEYITMCLLGQQIDATLVQSFLNHPEVRHCFPSDLDLSEPVCHCYPRINIKGAMCPFDDRIVFMGDCGVSKFYKDGIGAAYSMAKAAATTALFEGIAAKDFQQHYWPACRSMITDNTFGKGIFALTSLVKHITFAQRGMLRMVANEQQQTVKHQRMSTVLWDVFTGSAPYRQILLRMSDPFLLNSLVWNIAVGTRFFTKADQLALNVGGGQELGSVFPDGEIIVDQGSAGNCMYVIQAGQVEVFCEKEGKKVHLELLGEGDVFGEVPCFECKNCLTSVRAVGKTRVLTVDKRTFLREIHMNPSLAYHMLQTMAHRIQKLEAGVLRLKDKI